MRPASCHTRFIVTLALCAGSAIAEPSSALSNRSNASNTSDVGNITNISNETGDTPAPTAQPSSPPVATTTSATTVTPMSGEVDSKVEITAIDIVLIVVSVLVLVAVVLIVVWRVTHKTPEKPPQLYPLGDVKERQQQRNLQDERNSAGAGGPPPGGPVPAGVAPPGPITFKPKYVEPELEGQNTMYGLGAHAPTSPTREYSEVHGALDANASTDGVYGLGNSLAQRSSGDVYGNAPTNTVYDNSPMMRVNKSRIVTDKNGRVSLLLDGRDDRSSGSYRMDGEDVYGLAAGVVPATERPDDGVYANPPSMLRKQPAALDGVYFNTGAGDTASGSLLYGRIGDDAIGAIPEPPPSPRKLVDEDASVYGLALRPASQEGGYYANPDSLLRSKPDATEGMYFNDGGVSTEVGPAGSSNNVYGRGSSSCNSELGDISEAAEPGNTPLASNPRLVGPGGQQYYAQPSDSGPHGQPQVAAYAFVGNTGSMEKVPPPTFAESAPAPPIRLPESANAPSEDTAKIGTIISLQNLYGIQTRGSGRQFLSGEVKEELYASPSKINMVRPKHLLAGNRSSLPGNALVARPRGVAHPKYAARLSEPPPLPVRLSQLNIEQHEQGGHTEFSASP